MLTKVAVTYHHTLSKAFRQRLRLLADPSRAALRKPWDGRLVERGAVSQRLEAHLSRLPSIVAALRYDDLISTNRMMTEMPTSSRVMSSPMYGLSLTSDADLLVRGEPRSHFEAGCRGAGSGVARHEPRDRRHGEHLSHGVCGPLQA